MLFAALCAGACAAAIAGPYELSLNTERRGGQVSLAPRVEGPPGAHLRYEVVAVKEGSATARSQQAGEVTLDKDGSATLSQMSFSIVSEDRCQLQVRLYEAERLVASKSADCAR